MKRIAVIGDVHACHEEFQELVNVLKWMSLDEIWTVGDLVDRGPSNSKTIDICIDNNIKSVMGNHEDSILGIRHKVMNLRDGEKKRTLLELEPKHWDYISNLPYVHIDDKLGLIIVHAGVWPKIPIYAQPYNVCRAQMIHPYLKAGVRWWGEDVQLYNPTGKSEQGSRDEGWERWYKLYDYEQDCIFGHSTFAQPMIHQNPGMGKTIGVDTGSCFGGSVTACIYSSDKTFFFISVKAKKVWFKDTKRSFWEDL